MKLTTAGKFLLRVLCSTACTAVVLISADATAASPGFATVFGGPAYVPSTQNGYANPVFNSPLGILVNNSGVAVGSAERIDSGNSSGYRAMRWDGSGAAATELGNLGLFPGCCTTVRANAVNSSGTAVGWAEVYLPEGYRGERAVRWDGSGSVATQLGNLGTDSIGYSSLNEAYAVNSSGTAVGFSEKYVSGVDLGERAVRWNASGTAATELGNLGTISSSIYARAYAVNSSGTAVGYAEKFVSGQDRGQRAVRWAGSGTAATELTTSLGTKTNGVTTSEAYAVNDSGTAVGYARKYVSGVDFGNRAVRWDASTTIGTELGNLGTTAGGTTQSFAYAVNSSGTAVGYSTKYVSGVYYGDQAVRWDASSTTAIELGGLGNGYETFALAVNDSGTAVGWARPTISGIFHALAWRSDGIAIDLNTMIDPASGWTLNQAYGISNTGWVTGVGAFDADGPGGEAAYQRLFVMHMVPEPATSLLVVPALLWGLGRRSRKSLL
jgi:hypothetical protein